MATNQSDYHDEQFFRRFFDTLYDFRWQDVVAYWQDIPRRTRWIGITSLATLILVWVSLQLLSGVMAMAREAAMPSLEERMASPYALEMRLPPQLGVTQFITPAQAGYSATAFEATDTNLAYACMIYGAGEACNEGQLYPYTTYHEAYYFVDVNTAIFQEQIDMYEAQLALYQTAYAEEEARLIEVAMADALAQAEIAGTEIVINPDDLEIPPVVIDMVEPIMPDVDLLPEIRVVMMQFDTDASAQVAIETLFDTSRSVGNVGNFVLSPDMPVNYYYGISDGWRSFTWAHDNWVYTVSSTSYTTMETVVENFPY